MTLCFRPRAREIKRFPGPRIHCTSHRSEENPRAFRVSAARLSTGKKSPSRLSSFPPRARAQIVSLCVSVVFATGAGPVSLVSLLCITAPTLHGQPYRRSDLECYSRAVDNKASPGQCLLLQEVSAGGPLSHSLPLPPSCNPFPILPSPPPLNRIIMIYVTTSQGSGSESDTTIESGILQQGRTA